MILNLLRIRGYDICRKPGLARITMSSGTSVIAGIKFGPTKKNGKWYVSVYKHRGSGCPARKTQWHSSISPDVEYEIFETSDEGNWCDGASGHYYGVRNNAETILGSNGERVCKFPCPSNISDPWHGYPFRQNQKSFIPTNVLNNWLASKVIDISSYKRILKRTI